LVAFAAATSGGPEYWTVTDTEPAGIACPTVGELIVSDAFAGAGAAAAEASAAAEGELEGEGAATGDAVIGDAAAGLATAAVVAVEVGLAVEEQATTNTVLRSSIEKGK